MVRKFALQDPPTQARDLGGYHLVWARDAVNAGLGLLAVGQVDDARRMLAYLVAMQHPDGHWAQNFYPDGLPFWKAVQLDEVGFPILLAAKLREAGLLDEDGQDETSAGIRLMVERAAGYILRGRACNSPGPAGGKCRSECLHDCGPGCGAGGSGGVAGRRTSRLSPWRRG